ncbi:MAG: hypothetical protein DRH24_13835 [Deltaproteobacteria bacterium]|nr:MAG: hypothetical protein DRH24_13835 [Deltaproteobacteria bacterium]
MLPGNRLQLTSDVFYRPDSGLFIIGDCCSFLFADWRPVNYFYILIYMKNTAFKIITDFMGLDFTFI